MGTYPEYTGDIDARGSKVIVKFDDADGTYNHFKYNLNGVEANCTDCGIHIHTGTTCDDKDLVLDHYWNDTKVENRWTPDFSAVYNSDANGKANGSFDIDNGYGAAGNIDHAVVIHAQDGARVACGVLSKGRKAFKACAKKEKMTLQTCLHVYPGYDGDINVAGNVKVIFDGTDQKFKFNMKNADVDCLPEDDTCGIYIHTGTTCDDADLVGGHYWNETKVEDPWTPAGGAVYESNSKGRSKGKFDINSGFDYSENAGHAVVVHDKNGVRYGCGVLSSKKVKGCMNNKK